MWRASGLNNPGGPRNGARPGQAAGALKSFWKERKKETATVRLDRTDIRPSVYMRPRRWQEGGREERDTLEKN